MFYKRLVRLLIKNQATMMFAIKFAFHFTL